MDKIRVENIEALKLKSYKTLWINGKQIRLHRYLMQQHVGRELTFNEVVHHVNGNIWDNRIDNLEIVSRHEHPKIHFTGKVQKRTGKYLTCQYCGAVRYYCPTSLLNLSHEGENYKCRKCYTSGR